MQRLEEAINEVPAGVLTEIDPEDEMHWSGRDEQYFAAGASALRAIRLAQLTAGVDTFERILDMPSGHGRVLRVLKAAFPDAALTACDLNRAGVDFCARVLGARPVYSALEADDVPLDETFDLVWSGSLLTHLDVGRWKDFFSLYERSVAKGGLLVFTAFGRWPAERLRQRSFMYRMTDAEIPGMLEQFERDGFAYADYPAQELSGMSLTSPSWITRQIEEHSGLRLVGYTERGWMDHQDVIVCRRP
jgi:cyclopropane fatty-acyl-phospholipid synthase-like methyltransferase